MRTTLSIDDDVLLAARQLAEARGKSVGETISELARKGMRGVPSPERRGGIELLPVKGGGSRVTIFEVNELRDELA